MSILSIFQLNVDTTECIFKLEATANYFSV